MFNIGNIIKGHINEALNLNQDISEVRMKICKMCPIYLNMNGGICNRKLWLQPNSGQISLFEKEGFIRGCGCRLQAKTTLRDESCPAGKW